MTANTSKIMPSVTETKSERLNETTWIVELQEDPETGDLIMDVPLEALKASGWDIGDTLVWGVDSNGNYNLTKDGK